MKTIVVDDYFPFNEAIEKPAFSDTKGNELWVLILEKAWAKINQNYENTITGFITEAFRALTGAPVKFLNHDLYDDFWQKIKDADQKNYIICASAGKHGEQNTRDYSKSGLVSNHAYTVIQAVEINHPLDGQVKLLQLRNPWGHQEWMGDWSDKSDKWTPELRQ